MKNGDIFTGGLVAAISKIMQLRLTTPAHYGKHISDWRGLAGAVKPVATR